MSERERPLAAADIALAFGLLTRLPVRVAPATVAARGARAAWAWPLAGAAVGAFGGLAGALALALGLPPVLAAVAALTALVMATGAMHEDGLADAADGLWGGADRARRLEIMKDSRIGTYGVIALVLALMARAGALADLTTPGLIAPLVAAGAVSRLPMALALGALPNARAAGLAASVGCPPAVTTGLAAVLALAIAVFACGWTGLAMGLWAAAAALPVLLIARVKIGGQTGDILGAAQQCAEIAALAAAAVLLT